MVSGIPFMLISVGCRAAACVLLSVSPGIAATPAQPDRSAAPPPPATVRIVAAPPTAGRPSAAWIGLRFLIEPGWHIYWQNPGDSGGPPEVRWTLPPGVTAGPLRWPVPERVVLDTVVNYGYHGEVVLPARLEAPAPGWPDKPFVVTARVRWLACKEICLPGRSEASLELPARMEMPAGSGVDIDRALARVPGDAPASWRLSGSADRDQFTLHIETGSPESGADFFPLLPGQVDASAPVRAVSHARGVTLTLRKSDFLSRPVRSLRGVVVLSGRRAYEVAVHVADHH
jgi:thiol:disulfide interchange protein DsbD